MTVRPLRPKPAYARTVETTVYLDHGYGARGLGAALSGELLDRLGRYLDVAWFQRPLD